MIFGLSLYIYYPVQIYKTCSQFSNRKNKKLKRERDAKRELEIDAYIAHTISSIISLL